MEKMARDLPVRSIASRFRPLSARLPPLIAAVFLSILPVPNTAGERQPYGSAEGIERTSLPLSRRSDGTPAMDGDATRIAAKPGGRTGAAKTMSDEPRSGSLGIPGDPPAVRREAKGEAGSDPASEEHPLAQWTRKLAEARDRAERELAERALEGWRKALLEPGREAKGAVMHEVRPGETLSKIAADYGTTPEAILRLNGRVKSSKLAVGHRLKVLPGPFEARVDLASCRISLVWRSGVLREFPCCVGDPTRGQATPAGAFRVVDRVVNPMYTAPDGSTIPGGRPENPIGSRWIKFAPSLGIHGTNEPETIGKPLSKGCVRMRNEDVEWLYDFLPPGSVVVIY